MAISKLHETLASDGKLEILVKGCSIATRAAAAGMPAGAAAGDAERNNRRSELLAMLRRASIAHSPSTAAAKSRIWNTEYGIQNRPPRAGLTGCGFRFSFDRFVHTSHPPIGMQNAEFKIYDALAMDFRRAVSDLCRQFTPLEPI